MTVHKGERWSAARAYLDPALRRPNLFVGDAKPARPASSSTGAAPSASNIAASGVACAPSGHGAR